MSPIAIDPRAVVYTDLSVLEPGGRTTLLHTAGGGAIVHYWPDSHAVSVDTEAHSRPPKRGATSRPPLATSDEPLTRERRSQDARFFDADGLESPAACLTRQPVAHSVDARSSDESVAATRSGSRLIRCQGADVLR